jgi:capsular exopolysaccharide synthesis family protein
MEQIDYLSGLRRRWWVLVAAVMLGVFAGWATRSVSFGPTGPKRYEASAVILGSSDPNVTNLSTLSVLTTVGPVPRRVAHKLHYPDSPLDLAAKISTSPDQGSGVMWITAQSSTPTGAQQLANAFANQLVAYSIQGRNERSLADARWLRNQMNRLSNQIRQLEGRIASASPAEASLFTAQRDAKIQAYGALVTQYQQVTAGSFEPSSLQVIQRAGSASPVTQEGLFKGVSFSWRLTAGGILGFVLGLILALVIERFDRRIRTRDAAERSFGLPVLAEIPAGRRDRTPVVKRNGKVSSAAQPLPLLSAILEEGTSRLSGDRGNGSGRHRSQAILVTSPASGDGTSNVVARLATTFASDGKTVLVVSCDFRGSGVHRQFGVSNEHGLSDALSADEGQAFLKRYAVTTAVPNVWIVPSGRPPGNGGSVLGTERMRRILEEARSEVDVVLIEAAPVLADGDAAHLLRTIDSVLLVARTGKTTAEEARRTADILARLDAPVAGIALNGAGG